MDSEAIQATTKNVISVGVTKGVNALVTFGGSVLLTRLLMPADYGVFALAVFYFSFVVQFLDIGLDPALLAYQGDLRKAGGTHFVSKVVLACVGFLMVMTALPLDWASFQTKVMVLILTVANVFDSFGGTAKVLAERELRIWVLNLVELGATTLSWVAALMCVYWGMGLWSLGIQRVVLSLFQSLGFLLIGHQYFSFQYVSGIGKHFLVKFGVPIWIGSWFAWLLQTDRYLLSITHDFSSLGFYVKAFEFATLPLLGLGLFQRPIVPLYSRLQHQNFEIERLFNRVQLIKVRLVVPLLLGIELGADRIVLWLYGSEWLPIVPMVRIFLLYTFLRFLFDDSSYPLTIGFNAPALFTRVQIIQGLAAVGVWLITIPLWGTVGAAWGSVFVLLIACALVWWFIGRRVKLDLSRLFLYEMGYVLFSAVIWIAIQDVFEIFGIHTAFYSFVFVPVLVLLLTILMEVRLNGLRRIIRYLNAVPIRSESSN